ncbi:MAG: DUF349 domain-containing protein [Cytophagaceae bacterium]
MSSEKQVIEGDKNLEEVSKANAINIHQHPEDDNEPNDEVNDIEYSEFSKQDLLKAIENYRIEGNYAKAASFIKEVRSHFDNIMETERNEAQEKFLKEGGDENDFDFKGDALSQKFYGYYDRLKDEINRHFSSLEKEKDQNLVSKRSVLDKLRELITEESSTSIASLKELQEVWKSIGPVPAPYVQELWANYNALVERFYNNRSIYFELKELDRKKNLEVKKELCDKAEALLDESNILQAIKDLKVLHEEYKHIGPVPKENQEALWDRFKTASDKLYAKRNEHYSGLKNSLEENLNAKIAVIEKIEPFALFSTERIDEWKEKTSEVLALQEEWKKAGPVPQDKSKETSKRFWSSCKTFFHNKEKFFKELESQKVENLKKKEILCEEAENLKDNEDLVTTAKLLKDLQKKWEGIGPVPIKQKDAIFRRFKAACDHFFNRKREHMAVEEKSYHENLKKKEEICKQIEGLGMKKELDVDKFQELQEEFSKIGFVPKTEIKNIQVKYKQIVDSLLDRIDTKGDKEKEKMKLSLQVEAMKNLPAGQNSLHRTETDISKKISQLKSEIDRWTTNIEFFGISKNADKLKADFVKKIESAQKELDELMEQKKIISEAKK